MKGKIFNAQEVQAIIAGNKTQFREVIKVQPTNENQVFSTVASSIKNKDIGTHNFINPKATWEQTKKFKCPYQVGQKIFVKENFLQKLGSTQLPSGEHETFFTGSNVEYVADGAQERWDNPDVFYPNWWKKRPAQHMKQEHSRITLEITSIKVERLHDISEEDARLEGFPVDHLGNYYEPSKLDPWQGYATASFSLSWNPTHKKPEEKFYANPFVWVVDFKINK